MDAGHYNKLLSSITIINQTACFFHNQLGKWQDAADDDLADDIINVITICSGQPITLA